MLLSVDIATYKEATTHRYVTNWEDYDLLLITYGTFLNISRTILVPNIYFKTTHSGQRIIIKNVFDTDEVQIYKDNESPNSLALHAQ